MWMRQVWVLTRKEVQQLVRDRVLFVFVCYIFSLHVFISSGEVGSDLHNAAVLLHNADRGPEARELIYRFRPPYFRWTRDLLDLKEGVPILDGGEATMLIDIPESFGETLNSGTGTAQVQVLVDGSHATLGYLASSYAERIAAELGNQWTCERMAKLGQPSAAAPSIELRQRVWHNQELNEAWFATLSELLTMVTVTGMLIPAAALVREKERGTIEQLLVSPLSPAQVMLAKVLNMTFVMLAGTAFALLAVLRPVFGVPLRGSLALFFALTAIYGFTNAGIGLLAASFTRRTGPLGMLILLAVMPIVMLSGLRAPWESMPTWLRVLMGWSPMHHFVDISYSILFRGAGLSLLWESALIMTAAGSLLFALGILRFRRQFV